MIFMSNGAEDNVIHSFSERLALDQAVRSLADASNAFERERRAQELAKQGDKVVQALVRQLDTDHPGLRGGLGLLAQFLDHDAIAPILHHVAADPKRPQAARVTAIMILERYLDEHVDPRLAPDLNTASAIARQNAEEALRLAHDQPLVYFEYAEQLLDEPIEIIQAVIRVISQIENPQKAFLLATIAAYAPEGVIRPILRHLGSLRHPYAYQALSILAHLTPALPQAAARRQMRKLRMAGIQTDNSILRALWSPTAAGGQSILWFIRRSPQADTADLLVVLLHDMIGLIQADVQREIPLSELPFPEPRGYLHHLKVAGAAQTLYLAEITPAQGLALLDDAVTVMQAGEAPWPAELTVYGHWLWATPSYQETTPAWPSLPSPTQSPTDDQYKELLAHHAFAAWGWEIKLDDAFWQGDQAEKTLKEGNPAHQAAIQIILQPDNARLLSQRLQQQALWLTLIQQTDQAALVVAAQNAVTEGNEEHPFVRQFAWRSLLMAAADRATRTVLRLVK